MAPRFRPRIGHTQSLLHSCFLAVATALTVALELPLFSSSYFESKRFERKGRIYRWTGIQLFVAFLRLIGWERMWRKQSPVQNNGDALRKYAESTRGAEAIHAMAGLCIFALSVSIALRYSWSGTKWLLLVNAVVNLYPVMLQRYNRPRVERLLRRFDSDSPNETRTEQSDGRRAAGSAFSNG